MLKGARVLLVGLKSARRESTADMLRSSGATVQEADSAQVALLMLQTQPADLVLSDLSLPDADGYSLIAAIRKLTDTRLATVPAVAISDEATDSERQRALVAGFQLHMMRPQDARGFALTLSGLRRLSAASV